jgi:uncharacterized protein YjbJ (UPF0337 family)
MDKDTLKGKGKDAAGRIERQIGEWTDREDLEAEGAARQVEGKVQKTAGKIKEKGREMADRAEREMRAREKQNKDKAA